MVERTTEELIELIRQSESRQEEFIAYILEELVSFAYCENLYSEDDFEMSNDLRVAFENLGHKEGDRITFEEAVQYADTIDLYVNWFVLNDIADDKEWR